MLKEVVLSGIRPTGRLHLGSMLGAVDHFVKFQTDETKQCLFFLADWHALTTLDDPKVLSSNLIEMTKDYLAAGLDPDRSIIYAQSSVPQISELFLLLTMIESDGALRQLPAIKDMRARYKHFTHGMLSYPGLMAADILGPQASIVPVGADQVPNVEYARELARRFNNRFEQTFIEPLAYEQQLKIPGLQGGKMGKSDTDNAVGIHMTREEIAGLYRTRAITDPARVRKDIPGDAKNKCRSVYPFHVVLNPTEKETNDIANRCGSAQIGCAECKDLLVDQIMKKIEPFQEARREWEEKDSVVYEILRDGGLKARAIFSLTLEDVSEKMGICRFLSNA